MTTRMQKPRMTTRGRQVRWNRRLDEPEVDQGKVHGLPASWNPDDDRFYLHDTDEDMTTLRTFQATQHGWANLVQTAKRISRERRT